MTEVEAIKNSSSICIFFNGDLMTFQFDESMQMTPAILPSESNLNLMLAMLHDANKGLSA